MRAAIIDKIGFLHAAEFEGCADPLAMLSNAIEEKIKEEKERDDKWDIRNSLIVLPEALNIGWYGIQSVLPARPAQEFLEALRAEAEKYQVVFVVGVLEGRRNSAYMVDGKVAHLMCHKIGEDRTFIYDPCTGDPDPCNPIEFCGGVCVGALICMDADDDTERPRIARRQTEFLGRLGAFNGTKIVCVPARFCNHSRPILRTFSGLPGCYYIVAQGCRLNNMRSYIADSFHNKKAESMDKNEIQLWPLPQVPGVGFRSTGGEDEASAEDRDCDRVDSSAPYLA
jgi:predicted amidohydrolase